MGSAIADQDELVLARGHVARTRECFAAGNDVVRELHVDSIDRVVNAASAAFHFHYFVHRYSPYGRGSCSQTLDVRLVWTIL